MPFVRVADYEYINTRYIQNMEVRFEELKIILLYEDGVVSELYFTTNEQLNGCLERLLSAERK